MFRIQTIVFFLAVVLPTSVAHSGDASAALNRLRALGTAYMEEEDFPNAIRVYQEAAAQVPDSVSDAINLGIANYHGDRNEDCIRILKQACEKQPKNPFANYTLGLAYKKIGDSTNAVTYFQAVADVDATDAATLYNLGLAHLNLKNNDEAANWFKKTIAIDPAHSPAHYNLFLYYARVIKDANRAKGFMTRFQELKKKEPDRPASAVDEGKYLGPIEFEIPKDGQLNFTSELKARFALNPVWTDAVHQALISGATGAIPTARALTAIPDLTNHNTAIVIGNFAQTPLLVVAPDGKILKQTDLGKGITGCAPADYDNDGDVDLLVYAPAPTIRLLQNTGDWNLKEASGALSLPNDGLGCVDALWSDFDADGDMDLFLSRPILDDPQHGDLILQNNGNATFTDITAKIEGLPQGKSCSYAACDLDNDNDLDIIRASLNPQDPNNPLIRVEVFANQREVRFKKTAGKNIPIGYLNYDYQPLRLICRDFNNDRKMEIALPGLNFHQNPEYILALDAAGNLVSSPAFSNLAIPPTLQNAADLNNDGYEDLLVSWNPPQGAVGLEFNGSIPQVFWNQSPKEFAVDRETIPFPDSPSAFFFSPQIADLDFDGDLDLLLSTNSGLKIFENQTGNQNQSVELKIEGHKNPADGYGAKILVKDDLFFVKKEVTSPVTHIGLGDRKQADIIRITWPNGIFQNLIQTPAGTIKSVTEKPGYAGSCLFVYTWNGEKYDFIADSLCNAPLGLYVGGGYYPPNPDEYIRIPGNQIRTKDGQYEILMREELREITYLDQMELLSASHPEALEIHCNECFTMPPFPEFQLIGLSKNAHPPRKVTDNHGNDVTELLTQNDCRYPQPWIEDENEKSTRMDGVVKEHTFEIDLGDVQNAKTLYLFMTGYLDWPNSSNARSLEQNPEHDFVMPMLQVKNAKGEWQTVRNPMGFPAGKLKTVPVDLSNVFLTNDRTIRIVSTVQVHWDRMLVDTTPILDGFAVQQYPFKNAELRYGGYARAYQLSDAGPQWYDYSTRTDNYRWDYQTGAFTRYGDVSPLLTDFDDKYIIIQHGDEVCVHFGGEGEASAEPQSLTYFMKAVGWVKDLDYSTAYGQTVEPLPFKSMSAYPYRSNESYPWDAEHTAYWLEYNTRIFGRQEARLSKPLTIASPGEAAQSPRASE